MYNKNSIKTIVLVISMVVGCSQAIALPEKSSKTTKTLPTLDMNETYGLNSRNVNLPKCGGDIMSKNDFSHYAAKFYLSAQKSMFIFLIDAVRANKQNRKKTQTTPFSTRLAESYSDGIDITK